MGVVTDPPTRSAFDEEHETRKTPPVPLGNKCPNCGNATYHREGPILRCSRADCHAVGWINAPNPPGAGSGRLCKRCDGRTVRVIATVGGVEARYCYACGSTFLMA